MQSLDIISVNIWHIVISLCNLLILFLAVKKFLYKPIKAVLAKRQEQIDAQYATAAQAEQEAQNNKTAWEERMSTADSTVDAMIKKAADTAKRRGDAIVSEAKEKAENIVRQAEESAILERRNAEEGIRREIVDLSAELASKMLEREVKADDHRQLIDSFINNIGDAHD